MFVACVTQMEFYSRFSKLKKNADISHTKYDVVKTCVRYKLIDKKPFVPFQAETEKFN
jgi:hypothetical protein